jgi:anti-anti-sigma regulatory factor
MSAHIYYHTDKSNAILKITGALRFNECAPLEFFLKQLPQNKNIDLTIDLSEAELLDSTALGLLAQVAIQMPEHKPHLYCPDNDLQKVLLSMSLDQLFDFIKTPPNVPEKLSEVKIIAENEANQTKRALEAHRTLMGLSKENKEEFKSVVELLEESLRKK